CQLPLFEMPFIFDYGVPKFQAGQNPWKSFDEILYRKRSPFIPIRLGIRGITICILNMGK
ncbi:MAG: hypothetical protein PF542_04775, partial [Nanoarchaeota archaeon]|nr:hypothetical protein [Nanoarchaeota archaeon]